MAFWRALAGRLLALGRPFIIMGDFQVEPGDMLKTELLRLLDASIVAPGGATNLVTGSQIDYFIISRALLGGSDGDDDGSDNGVLSEKPTATAIYGCKFSPHVPVRLRLTTSHTRREVQRLAIPRPLPACRPVGPQPPGCRVDWEGWAHRNGLDAASIDNASAADMPRLEAALDSWYAGVEAELLTIFGLFGSPAESTYSGIGRVPKVVASAGQGRFRDVHDDGGVVGHRLAWAAKALHQVASAAAKVRRAAEGHMTEDDRRHCERYIDIIKRLGHRADAFRREVPKLNFNIDGQQDVESETALKRAFRYLAAALRPRRGEHPLLWQWLNGSGTRAIAEAHQLHAETETILERRMRTARSRALKAARRWARLASLGASHAATRPRDTALAFSASADKGHRGEASPQAAADKGLREWATPWGATDADTAEEVLRTVGLMEKVERDFPEIVLPRLTGGDIQRAAGHFKWFTGTGADVGRLRHLLYVSRQAADALAGILMNIEAMQRWPAAVRIVIANAIPKKAGGSRLIGLATMVYRLWTKIRYEHVHATLEQRIERPYLDAAPGKGAARAAFSAASRAEAAVARKEVAATTMVDISHFYESIQIVDVVAGARAFGMPEAILMLSVHMYLGPRRIKVGEAISAPAYPTKTVLPGCAWATVHVRLLLVKPVDQFMRRLSAQIEDWLVFVYLSLYVDDWALTTTGTASKVAFVHPIITRALLLWIRAFLRMKMAPDKIGCVASDPRLRDILHKHLKADGVPVSVHGDLLGVDYTAGGYLYGKGKSKATNKRLAKQGRRATKVKWLHRIGGKARAVVRGGIAAGRRYGDEIRGMPPGQARSLRLIHGAVAKIKAVGGSLTARLAMGNDSFEEYDPLVQRPNPALMMILATIWDHPRRRRDFIDSWRAARKDLVGQEPRNAWRRVRGPVGVAMLQALSIGIKWDRPFTIELLGHTVDVLETPPRQIALILTEHARVHADHVMLTKLAVDRGWEIDKVLSTYRHGIDWCVTRAALLDRDGLLTAVEKRALRLVAVGGFWPESRRWVNGYGGVGTCTSCYTEIGDHKHRLGDCPALQDYLLWQRIAGRIKRDDPTTMNDESLAPLVEMALPPKAIAWEPVIGENVQGSLRPASGDKSFSDGSGLGQQLPHQRISTWSVVRAPAEGGIAREVIRGRVAGWFRTVPRAEIRAAIAWLEHARPGATGVSDCQHVVDVIAGGVSKKWTGSASINADLWQRARGAVDRLGGTARLLKTRAHRSRSAALVDSEDPFEHWVGNGVADYHAKQKAAEEARANNGEHVTNQARQHAAEVIRRIAIAAGWALKQLPVVERDPKKSKRYGGQSMDVGKCGDHELVRAAGGKLQCRWCKLFTRTVSSYKCLRNTPCRGDIVSRTHETHVLAWTAGVTWCRRCGAYASRLPRRLVAPCAGHPMSEAQANVLRRLRCGLMPTTARYMRDAAAAAADVGRQDDDGRVTAERGAVDGHRLQNGAQAEEDGHSITIGVSAVRHHGSESISSSNAAVEEVVRSVLTARQDEAQIHQQPDRHQPPVDAGELVPTRLSTQRQLARTQRQAEERTRRRLNAKAPPEMMFDDRSRWCLAKFDGGWSSRLGPRLPVAGGCIACSAPTRTTCRGCVRPLCFGCLQGRARCPRLQLQAHPPQRHRVHTADEAVSGASAVIHSLSPVPATSGGHHHHHHHGSSEANFNEAPHLTAAPGDGHHHHHGGSQGFLPEGSQRSHLMPARPVGHASGQNMLQEGCASVSSTCDSNAASRDGYHHRRHQGCPEAGAFDIPHGSQPSFARAENLASEQNTLHEDEAKQHTVVFSVPLKSSVPLLSQGLVAPVVVAAEAAEVSCEVGPPQQRLTHSVEKITDRRDASPTTSPSAAAATSSSCKMGAPLTSAMSSHIRS